MHLEYFLALQGLNVPIAFLGGIVSFFAPCVVPLLPAYISYVTGVSLKDLKGKGYEPFRKKLIGSSLFYILGFSLIFVLLGGIAGNVGGALRLYSRQIQILGGLLMIVFGLDVVEVLQMGFLAKERKMSLPRWGEKISYLKPFLLGVIFAAAWTPCIGPILGSILALAATSSSGISGAILLFIYSLGISLPFFIISLTLAGAPKYIKSFQNILLRGTKIAGYVLIAIGATLVLGWYAHINAFVLQWL